MRNGPERKKIYAVISIGSSVGNYRVVSKLGAGAMATVYLAEHPRINKKVAIKVINQDLASSPEMVSRFMTEARAASQIGHDHIVDILDFGQSPEGENFMIMEYLEGQTISSRIRGAGNLDVMTTLHIALQIVDALQVAHGKGVIHRDLKPDNIYLIRRAGTTDYVKILDFGLAKLLTGSEGQNHKTSSGSVLGTPHYMAPEQCEGKLTIDGRADLYSVGCIMYQMLTGELPFPGEGFAEVLIKHLSESPPLVRVRNPLVPPSVEKLILHCLAKSRDHRFQTAEEVCWALRDPDTWSQQFGEDMMRIVGPLPGRSVPMLPPQMPTMHSTANPPAMTVGPQMPISPVSTVNLPPPGSPGSSAVQSNRPVAAATVTVGSSPHIPAVGQFPGQSALRPAAPPPAMPHSLLDIPVMVSDSPQLAEVPADASRAAPQMATLISDLSSASLSALLRQPAGPGQRSPSTPPAAAVPATPPPDDELSTLDGSSVAGLSAQNGALGPQPTPGPASGFHPAALPPPAPASQPPTSVGPLEKLKALPPVQRFLALPEPTRLRVLAIAGGMLALFFILLTVIILWPDDVSVSLRTTPEGTEVVRGGKVIGKTPLALKLGQGESVRLLFRKTGFTSVERTVKAQKDTTVSVELTEEIPDKIPDKTPVKVPDKTPVKVPDKTPLKTPDKTPDAPKTPPTKTGPKTPPKNTKKTKKLKMF